MAYPFSRLRTDRFWHRIPKPGYDADIEYNVSSMERLREMYFGAKRNDEFFGFMTQPDTRERLRSERETRLLDCCSYQKMDVGRRT